MDIFNQIAQKLGIKTPSSLSNPANQQQPQNPQQQALQQQQNKDGQLQRNPDAGNGNGQNSNQQNNGANAPQPAQSAQDKFAALWQNDPSKQKKGPQPLFNPDMKAFGAAVDSMNFAGEVPQDAIQKILAGDAQALISLLNGVGRRGYSEAVQANMHMTQEAINRTRGEFSQMMDDRFSSLSSSNALRNKNPAFSNPKYRTLVEGVKEQIRSKFPEATPDEIIAMTQEYFGEMQKDFMPQQQPQKPQGKFQTANGEFDWDGWAASEQTQAQTQEPQQQDAMQAQFAQH